MSHVLVVLVCGVLTLAAVVTVSMRDVLVIPGGVPGGGECDRGFEN